MASCEEIVSVMSGPWTGWHTHADNTEQTHETNFVLFAYPRQRKTYLSGTGRDRAGVFVLGGNIDPSGEWFFLKSYPGVERVWTYSGQVLYEKRSATGTGSLFPGVLKKCPFAFWRVDDPIPGLVALERTLNRRGDPAKLCELCRRIPFQDLPKFSAVGSHVPEVGFRARSGRILPVKIGFQHHQSLDDLRVSSSACTLCSLILDAVVGFQGKVKDLGSKASSVLRIRDFRLTLTARGFHEDGIRVWSESPIKGENVLVGLIGFCVDNDSDVLSGEFRGRVVKEDPSSESTLRRVMNWVRRCNSEHEACKLECIPLLPTRVLDISGPSPSRQVRVWETNGARGSYIALSHCWGAHAPCMTTRDNLEERKKGIAFGELTKTFQDAIFVARALGIRYLWIDSLCILQGDKADWEAECSKMEDVYAGSYLTIAASGAKDGTVGCFALRPARRYSSFWFPSQTGMTGQLVCQTLPLTRDGENATFDSQPLRLRGWAVQERVLSSRMLFYCTDQCYYECKQETFGEDGYYSKKGHRSDMDISLSPYKTRLFWDSLMDALRGCRLTRASDKLPSLSGIARRCETVLGDRYVAGLWASTLLQDLLWNGPLSSSLAPWPPRTYRAPSWSWACIDDAHPPIHSLRPSSTLASVVAYHVQEKYRNRWGEVSSGWVKIRAPMVRVLLDKDSPTGWSKGKFRFTTLDGKLLKSPSGLDYDIDVDALKRMEISALVVGWIQSGKSTWYLSLLVARCKDGSGSSRRLGYFLIMNRDELGGDQILLGTNYAVVTLV